MKLLIFIFSIQSLHAFSKVAENPVPAPVPSVDSTFYFPVKAWGEHALKQVKASRLLSVSPIDAKSFCPNGMSANNWVHLLAAMTKYESGFKPSSTYKENFKNSKGEYVLSTGLLQLSYESVRGYGFRVTTEQLKDPLLNLTIGIKILERWVVQDKRIASGSPYKGGSRYWSVLRPTGKLSSVQTTIKPWCE